MKQIIFLVVTVLLIATGIIGLGFQHIESEGSKKERDKSSPQNIEVKEVQLEGYETFLDFMDDSIEEDFKKAASDRGMTVKEFKESINKED